MTRYIGLRTRNLSQSRKYFVRKIFSTGICRNGPIRLRKKLETESLFRKSTNRPIYPVHEAMVHSYHPYFPYSFSILNSLQYNIAHLRRKREEKSRAALAGVALRSPIHGEKFISKLYYFHKKILYFFSDAGSHSKSRIFTILNSTF